MHNVVNDRSAQFCGCDPGANHLCEVHRVSTETMKRERPFSEAAFEALKAHGEKAYREEQLDLLRDGRNVLCGIGGAPTRNTTLPTDGAERKMYPVASGVLDYFPDAIAQLAHISWLGNEQHNPGKPLHWDRSKSADESDTMIRHFLQRGTRDTDGTRHTAKMAWRALAILQKEIEAEHE